jgi:hypothetical protein
VGQQRQCRPRCDELLISEQVFCDSPREDQSFQMAAMARV